LCYVDIRRGILLFTALGCVRAVQVGAFSGRDTTQGLLLVQVLATALIAAWLLRVAMGRQAPVRRTPIDTPLLLLLPVAAVSLVVGFTWFDPAVAVQHMKVDVSIAQILLILWPIGIYLVVANSVTDDRTILMIRRIIIVLALPSLGLVVAPHAGLPYLLWSTAFALPASSLCFAEVFYTRSLPRRLALLAMTFAPAVYGYAQGKAFFYGYVVASCATILVLKAPRPALAAAPVVFAAYVLAVPVASGSLTPAFLAKAIATEQSQQSLGGEGGRDRLIADGVSIWARHPVFGVGPANNYPYMLRYSTLGTAHNQYVDLLMELGIVGLLLFLVFAFRAGRMGLRVWRTARDPLRQQVVLGWLGLFAAMLAGGMFGDFMLPSIRNGGLELLALFYVQWILLGVMVSISALERGPGGRHGAA
jgi:O-antigen ligase